MSIKKQILATLCMSVLSLSGLRLYAQTIPMSSTDGTFNKHQQLAAHPGKIQAPNVASFDRIHEVNVDMFNGIPTLYHPLLTAQGDDMNFNIGLSYNGGGIKVNETAGWVGLNWNMTGDYQIVRKVNDLPDERFNKRNVVHDQWLDRGYLYSAKEQMDNNNWNTPSFLGSEFMPAFWNSSSNPQQARRLILDSEPDEFMFNLPGGISGSFFRSEKAGPNDSNGWRVRSKDNLKIDIVHEAFANGNPIDADYYFTLDKFTSPHKKINLYFLFTKFVLTTPDGYRYTFGGVDSAMEVNRGILQDPTGMLRIDAFFQTQFTVNSWKLTKIQAPSGEEINLTYKRGKILFHLTKDFINEVYQSNGHVASPVLHHSASVTYPVYLSKVETSRQIIYFKRSQAIEKWYKKLETIGCNFMPAPSGWNTPIQTNKDFSDVVLYQDMYDWGASGYIIAGPSTNPDHMLPNYNQQLDSIILFDKTTNTNVYGYKLLHSASTNQRRTLNGYYKFNFLNSQIDNNYEFTYSGITELPDLMSINRDFWGFPNYASSSADQARCGFNEFMDIPHSFPYAATKGYLKSIKNPMGGITELIYEPNTYLKKIKVDVPNNIVNVSNLTSDDIHASPGARISQIKKQDYFGAVPVVKEYKYVSNYPNSTASSGILNFDYLEGDVITVDNYGSNVTLSNRSTLGYQQFVNQFRGGIVNYSEVVEITPGNGYTIYKYTNSEEPQYRDEMHAGYGNNNVIAQRNFRLSSSDLDRGKLKQVSHFNNNNKLLKEQVMTYENNPNRKNEYVKAISKQTLLTTGNWGEGIPNFRAWAYKIYTYKNPLIKTVESTYEEDGTVAFSQEKNFNYDQYGNLVLETETTSDGKVLSKATKFNSHPDYSATTVSGSEASGLKLLNTLGIKNYPVEQLVYTDQPIPLPNTNGLSRILTGTEFVYKSNKPVLDKEYALELDAPLEGMNSSFNPNGLKSSKINGIGVWEQDSRFILQKSYPHYTGQLFANKPKTIMGKAENEAIIWDYAGKYPVATFQNTTAEEVAYTGFEGDYNGTNSEFKNGWQFSGNNFQGTAAKIGRGAIFVTPSTTKTVADVFINSAISLQNGKKYRLCFWAPGSNNFQYYTAYNGNIAQVQPLKTGTNGLSYFEMEFTASGTGSIGLICYRAPTGSGPAYLAPIDEIALFPVGSGFRSASYDAATGQILSINDGAGHLQLFEYDVFNRLIKVKDENEHLVTDHEYKIQSTN
ncbi:MAG: RHS repeat protein [Taibaiella sp.]|nr:RHS repeat protein [Taibaiella sp.]